MRASNKLPSLGSSNEWFSGWGAWNTHDANTVHTTCTHNWANQRVRNCAPDPVPDCSWATLIECVFLNKSYHFSVPLFLPSTVGKCIEKARSYRFWPITTFGGWENLPHLTDFTVETKLSYGFQERERNSTKKRGVNIITGSVVSFWLKSEIVKYSLWSCNWNPQAVIDCSAQKSIMDSSTPCGV